jgi:DNA (cytosine-5)-methyltransferase 1
MSRPKLLDAFCGEGGCSRGYADAGFDVFGVDNSAARLARYPYPSARGDAVGFILAHGHEFDAIHASPPCTGYSRGTAAIPDRMARYDRLIGATREALLIAGRPYVIENVEDARPELVDPLTLCWTEFYQAGTVEDEDGTPLWMKRHRLFESNVHLWGAGGCTHPKDMQCAGAYGGARRDKIEARTIRHGGYVPRLPVMRELLGIDWMTEKGCQLSIPPAYTEHIGRQLLAHLNAEAVA